MSPLSSTRAPTPSLTHDRDDTAHQREGQSCARRIDLRHRGATVDAAGVRRTTVLRLAPVGWRSIHRKSSRRQQYCCSQHRPHSSYRLHPCCFLYWILARTSHRERLRTSEYKHEACQWWKAHLNRGLPRPISYVERMDVKFVDGELCDACRSISCAARRARSGPSRCERKWGVRCN